MIQDTTTLNYSGQKERQDTGPIQQDNVRGIFLHPTLAITPNRECLGIVDYEQWSREKFTHQTSEERKKQRYYKSIKEKESYRWVRGYKKASKLAKAIPDNHFVYIADREGDVAFSKDKYEPYRNGQLIKTEHEQLHIRLYDQLDGLMSLLENTGFKQIKTIKALDRSIPPEEIAKSIIFECMK